MSERTRNIVTIAVVVVALGVVAVGLRPPASEAPPTPAERARQLEVRLRCPICVGESLADSQAKVAKDLRALIERRIAEGATDQEIIDEFVANYGEAILLDPPTRSWGLALWLVPLALAIVGGFVVVRLRRPAEVGEP